MKSFKKISAIVLVVAMILTMVSFNVFAANPEITVELTDINGNPITQAKAGSTVQLRVYLSEGTYSNVAINLYTFNGSVNESVIVDNDASEDYSVVDEVGVNLTWMKTTIKKDENVLPPIAIIPIEINNDATGETTLFKYNAFMTNDDENGIFEYYSMKDQKVNVVQPWEITGFEKITKNIDLGTTEADVKALLPKTVTATGKVDGEDVTEVRDVEEWVCTGDPAYVGGAEAVPGTYTFTGTIAADDSKLGIIGDVQPTVNVVVAPIAYSKAIALEGEIMEVAETEPTDAAMAATLPTTYTVTGTSAGVEFTDTVNITWADTATSKSTDFAGVAGDTATFEGTADVATANNLFSVSSVVTGTVKITPAIVEGAEMSIEKLGYTSKPEVTVKIPGTELVNSGTIEVTFYKEVTDEKGNITLTPIANGTATATTDATTDADGNENYPSEFTVKFDKSYKNLKMEAGTVFTVKATYEGRPLADDKGAELAITKTVMNVSSSKPAGTNNPVGNNGTGTQPGSTDKPVDPDIPVDPDGPVGPVEPSFVPGPFDDVHGDFWAAEAIAALKEAGIIGGVSETEFAPDADVTRAEFVKMIVGLKGLEVGGEVAFTDCPADEWFTPYVAAAVEAGLVTGVSETEFAPDATITRQDAFTIIGRALGVTSDAAMAFADADQIADYAKGYMAALAEVGVIGGYEDGTVRPTANITRAEAAKVMAGLLGTFVTEEPVEGTTEASAE